MAGVKEKIFFAKSHKGLNIYNNLTKRVIEGINNVTWISGSFINRINIVWLEIFEDIFLIPLIFFEKIW